MWLRVCGEWTMSKPAAFIQRGKERENPSWHLPWWASRWVLLYSWGPQNRWVHSPCVRKKKLRLKELPKDTLWGDEATRFAPRAPDSCIYLGYRFLSKVGHSEPAIFMEPWESLTAAPSASWSFYCCQFFHAKGSVWLIFVCHLIFWPWPRVPLL